MEEKSIWRLKRGGLLLAHWAQKVGRRLPALPNRLHRKTANAHRPHEVSAMWPIEVALERDIGLR